MRLEVAHDQFPLRQCQRSPHVVTAEDLGARKRSLYPSVPASIRRNMPVLPSRMKNMPSARMNEPRPK